MIYLFSKGKSSDIQQAEKIFRSITQPDIFTYTAMSNNEIIDFILSLMSHLVVNAYTRNGMGYEALGIYEKIPDNLHDSILYICILNACSHSGLVDQARNIFKKVPRKTDVVVTAMVCSFEILKEKNILYGNFRLIVSVGWNYSMKHKN